MNCPFCIQMFEDGIPSVERDEAQRMKTYDVAELLEQAVLGRRNGAKSEKPQPVEVAAGDPPDESEPSS